MALLVSAGLLLLVAGTQASGPAPSSGQDLGDLACTRSITPFVVPTGFTWKGRDPFRHPVAGDPDLDRSGDAHV